MNPFNAFKPPTKDNPQWQIPSIEIVIDAFRLKGGSVNQLLAAISDEVADHEQLLFLILDELNKPENEAHLKSWRRYTALNLKNKMLRGTDQIMELYSHGSLDKHQFVKDLGKTILPEIFDPSKGGLGKENEDEKELTSELNDLAQ